MQEIKDATLTRSGQERAPPSKLSRFRFEHGRVVSRSIWDRLIQHGAERAKRERDQLTPVPGDTELQCACTQAHRRERTLNARQQLTEQFAQVDEQAM